MPIGIAARIIRGYANANGAAIFAIGVVARCFRPTPAACAKHLLSYSAVNRCAARGSSRPLSCGITDCYVADPQALPARRRWTIAILIASITVHIAMCKRLGTME